MMTNEQILEVTQGYINAMLWSTGDGEEHESYEGFELSDEASTKAYQICFKFVFENLKDCKEWANELGYGDIGHNLWLNSAGHGVGFWDRDMDELGDRLSEASRKFTIECYLGDDNLVYMGV